VDEYLRPSSDIQTNCSLVSLTQCRKANNVSPFETIFCVSFLPGSGLANIFEGVYPNFRYFSKRFFRVRKSEFNNTIFVINPVTFSAPYILAPRAAARLARHLVSAFTSRNTSFVCTSHASSINRILLLHVSHTYIEIVSVFSAVRRSQHSLFRRPGLYTEKLRFDSWQVQFIFLVSKDYS
jgi:hypothetical protein